MIKSRRMRWDGTCSTHGREKFITLFWLENLKGRDHLEDIDVDGNTILDGS
jgi:hypothetical protein